MTKVGDTETEGTTLDSLFLGLSSPLGEKSLPMDGVDHESLASEDVGIDYGDDEEKDDEDEDEDDKIPIVCNGKNFFKGLASQRVFEANEDGTPGDCVGVWLHDSFVPLVPQS